MIHKSAIISSKAQIGENVTIGPFSIVHDNVDIGDNTIIGSYCEIGASTPLAASNNLKIGHSSIIRSHTTVYSGSTIKSHFHTGHYVCIRENSSIGHHVQIGSRGDIQGDCIIGDFTKMHADVHIGKLSKIGSFVWLFPEVLLTNDPTPPSEELKGVTIEDFVVVAAKSLLMPGIKLEKDCVISAGSIVKDDVKSGMLVSGNPARPVCKANILRHHEHINIKAYPWRKRFSRGYSKEDVTQWQNEE